LVNDWIVFSRETRPGDAVEVEGVLPPPAAAPAEDVVVTALVAEPEEAELEAAEPEAAEPEVAELEADEPEAAEPRDDEEVATTEVEEAGDE
jgi:hypothetical protein